MKNLWKIFVNGLFKENPVLKLVLGCCSVLAVSVTVLGSLGMGAALTFVLVGSNVVISALRKIIPDKIRIPCYIVVIASFVTVVQMVLEAYMKSLYDTLGIFLPLIVVNCIVLGRAEMFANKHNPLESLLLFLKIHRLACKAVAGHDHEALLCLCIGLEIKWIIPLRIDVKQKIKIDISLASEEMA